MDAPNTTGSDLLTTPDAYTTASMYGYATLSVACISLLSLCGVLLLPFLNGKWYDNIMQYVLGIGVGALFSDAILHMVPFVLGVHSDEAGHEEESHEQTWKLSAIIAGVWLFYLFECSIKLWHRRERGEAGDLEKDLQLSVISNSNVKMNGNAKANGNAEENGHVGTEFMKCSDHVHSTMQREAPSDNERNHVEDGEEFVCGITPVCMMIFIGDIAHNFGDGLAIGVAFGISLPSGIGTTVAVFCHELPHEFADFALYLTHGSSKKQAILLNVLAALCAFFGLYLGLLISKETSAQQWMLALIAGFFIYNALVIVLPEMISHVTKKPTIIFVLQNLGLITGWMVLALLAFFEEDIEGAFMT